MFDIFSSENTQYFVQSKIEETVTDIRKGRDKWTFRCPVCGDSRKNRSLRRGNYYLSNNSYHCFNEETCGASGLWIVCKFTGQDYDHVKREFVGFQKRFGYDKQIFKPAPKPITPPVEPLKIFNIPDHWITITEKDTPAAYHYLSARKIFEAPYLPRRYTFYLNIQNERLVLPWMLDGELVYWQERALKKDQTPKYLFPPERKAKKTVFGVDNIDMNFPYIFLIEGVMDAIYVKNGVAIGGLDYTDFQKTLMDRWPMCELVYFLDNHRVDESSKNKLERLIKKNDRQKIFAWPKGITSKDVNEYYCENGENPFGNPEFLEKRIYKGLLGLMEVRGSL